MRLETPSPMTKADAEKVTPAHTHSRHLGAGTKETLLKCIREYPPFCGYILRYNYVMYSKKTEKKFLYNLVWYSEMYSQSPYTIWY